MCVCVRVVCVGVWVGGCAHVRVCMCSNELLRHTIYFLMTIKE